ncbi:WD40 repeat domain-containing protein [Nannocystis radixulma]|uniref:WD40 repeat domain-containing protein n=1 Tax=Nannocystis radixulma TaxID=2995305 RepID=A0ABT5B963_9BACT|nr:hypothetical protein [Nannocystis radixulma]MDC0670678.1 hypothetical protein [Nannocystis radixulma]
MSWSPIPVVPIIRHPDAPASPRLQYFAGKPHALAFLADGSLVVGASRNLTLHDPEGPTPPRAALELGGAVEWMMAHPDGESVLVAVRNARDSAMLRVWPATARIVNLFTEPSFGWQFTGNLNPDGTRLIWRRNGQPPTLRTVDVATGELLTEFALPQDTNGTQTMAVRPDDAVYIKSRPSLLIHPDGRMEEATDTGFFEPFFATTGAVMSTCGRRYIRVDDKLEESGRLPESASGGTISHDRRWLTFYSLSWVQVWDALARSVVFAVNRHGVYGQHPWWRGQYAAASTTHLAAIDHRDATVAIWRIGQPDEPIARLTDYSQGAQRLMFHGDGKCTAHTCQPPNTWTSLMEFELATGAAKMAQIAHIVDMARSSDGQRTIILHEKHRADTLSVSELNPDAEEVSSVDVQRAGGTIAMSPNGAVWGVVTHAYPKDHHAGYTAQVQWRPFGAGKWSKTVKLKGIWQHIVLCDTAAAIMVGHELVVIALAKNKTLLTVTLPEEAEAIAISRDGAHVGVGCRDRQRLVHVASGTITELEHDIPGERQWPKAVAFDEHGTSLFVGFPCGAITQHRVLTGALTATLRGHHDEVCALAWHDGHLWSGSQDGTIFQWGELA